MADATDRAVKQRQAETIRHAQMYQCHQALRSLGNLIVIRIPQLASVFMRYKRLRLVDNAEFFQMVRDIRQSCEANQLHQRRENAHQMFRLGTVGLVVNAVSCGYVVYGNMAKRLLTANFKRYKQGESRMRWIWKPNIAVTNRPMLSFSIQMVKCVSLVTFFSAFKDSKAPARLILFAMNHCTLKRVCNNSLIVR